MLVDAHHLYRCRASTPPAQLPSGSATYHAVGTICCVRPQSMEALANLVTAARAPAWYRRRRHGLYLGLQ
eukprot:scaffold442_cov397-Prasinococcus_capsulatus_cf.AAC.25